MFLLLEAVRLGGRRRERCDGLLLQEGPAPTLLRERVVLVLGPEQGLVELRRRRVAREAPLIKKRLEKPTTMRCSFFV